MWKRRPAGRGGLVAPPSPLGERAAFLRPGPRERLSGRWRAAELMRGARSWGLAFPEGVFGLSCFGSKQPRALLWAGMPCRVGASMDARDQGKGGNANDPAAQASDAPSPSAPRRFFAGKGRCHRRSGGAGEFFFVSMGRAGAVLLKGVRLGGPRPGSACWAGAPRWGWG